MDLNLTPKEQHFRDEFRTWLKANVPPEIVGVASVGRQRFTPQPRKNVRYQLKDTVSFFSGTHSTKFGFDVNEVRTDFTALPLHFGGRYIFAALPAIPQLGITQPLSALRAFALGLPAAYVQGYGQTGASYNDPDYSLFAQDDWNISSKLIVKAGLRYQRQIMYNIPYTVSMPCGGTYTYKIPQDKNNLGPRLSITYDPKGDGRSSLHAAWGIFYDNNILAAAQIGDGINGAADGVRTLVLRFPNSIAAWKAPGYKLPEPLTPYPSLVISPDPGFKTGSAQQAAVGYDRAIGQTVSVSADLLWVHGKNQRRYALEPAVRARRAARPRGDGRRVQPLQSGELHGDQQHFRHGRFPEQAVDRRAGARHIRDVHRGAAGAADPARSEVGFLIGTSVHAASALVRGAGAV